MSFKPKKLTVAVMMALGSVSLAQAQTATTEKTVITGSNIKRIDAETVAPVDIITREQIERTGLPTIAEVLRNVPANTGGSFNEQFSTSFAPGASGISLRGLGQKTTLVLINGRRTSGYGFAQNIQDTFVDLNSIPSSAVERVEILKDGASAIYGSDAIAGVVNVILRRDFRGGEVAVEGGFYDGKREYRASITGGFGDLAKDKFNVLGVFDYFKRNELLLSETDFGKSRDKRGERGGQNFQSITGGIWRNAVPTANGSFTNGNTARAIAACPNVITAANAVDLGLLGATSGLNIAGNTFCLRDFNSEQSALPGTERYGFLGRGTIEFTPNLQGCGTIADGANTMITFDEGKRCWINKVIFKQAAASQAVTNPDPAKRQVFAAGDSDTDIAFLKDATELVDTEFIVVFDADYLPSRGLIRRLMAPFFDPEVGAVMGRVVPNNVGANLLTRLLDLERSGGYQVDQQARMNLGLVPQYGGTVGGIRLAALHSVGGWHDDVLAEDTDLTFRLLLGGWLTVYHNRSECYEEVPQSWAVRVRQIKRWAKGHNQALVRHGVALMTQRQIGLAERIDGLLLLGVYMMSPLLILGWMMSLLLYFTVSLEAATPALVVVAFMGHSALGNFAAFFEIAAAVHLDRSRQRVRLLAFNWLGFIVSAVAIARAVLEQAVLDRRPGRKLVWDKTVRYRQASSTPPGPGP